jgi:hypothetical protein
MTSYYIQSRTTSPAQTLRLTAQHRCGFLRAPSSWLSPCAFTNNTALAVRPARAAFDPPTPRYYERRLAWKLTPI